MALTPRRHDYAATLCWCGSTHSWEKASCSHVVMHNTRRVFRSGKWTHARECLDCGDTLYGEWLAR